jgi:hypothetical protein
VELISETDMRTIRNNALSTQENNLKQVASVLQRDFKLDLCGPQKQPTIFTTYQNKDFHKKMYMGGWETAAKQTHTFQVSLVVLAGFPGFVHCMFRMEQLYTFKGFF